MTPTASPGLMAGAGFHNQPHRARLRRAVAAAVGAGALLFCAAVQAGSGWTDYVNVAELVPTSRPYYVVRLMVHHNPSGCQDKTRFYQNYGTIGADKMFRTLLEAVKSGLKVRVYVTGICNFHGYSEISSVSIVPR